MITFTVQAGIWKHCMLFATAMALQGDMEKYPHEELFGQCKGSVTWGTNSAVDASESIEDDREGFDRPPCCS